MSDKYLNKTIVYVDSHQRTSGSHGDFTYKIKLDKKDVDSVVVLSSTIKKSYHLIEDGFNTFILKEGIIETTITIPIGNYSASTFKTVVQGLLNTNSPNLWTYAITLPNTATTAQTGQFTYTVSGNSSQPSFIFDKHLFEQFGFESSSTNTFVADTITSTNMVYFQLLDVIRIHSDLSHKGGNILQEISAISPDFSTLKYNCIDIDANSKNFTLTEQNIFEFTCLDEEYRRINLTLNVLITLMFYKKNTLQDQANALLIDYIKYKFLLHSNKPQNTKKI